MIAPRTVLAVPGDSARFLAAAGRTDADVLMIDLEDGVGEAGKAAARDSARRAASTTLLGRRIWLRINPIESRYWGADVVLARELAGLLDAVVVPKSDARTVEMAASSVSASIIPLIESARGVEESEVIARSGRAPGVMFGQLDYIADLAAAGGVGASSASWAEARVVNATAANGKWAVAGPTADTRDLAVTDDDSTRARAIGFAGKLCIHPAQLPIVAARFGIAAGDLAWARRVLAAGDASAGGAFSFEGTMVDSPVLERALRIVLAAEARG